MLNADPNHAGTHSGLNVPSHGMPVVSPSQRKSANSETIVTGNGIIIVESISAKSTPRRRSGCLAKPYATSALEIVVPATPSAAMISVLRVHSRKSRLRIARTTSSSSAG